MDISQSECTASQDEITGRAGPCRGVCISGGVSWGEGSLVLEFARRGVFIGECFIGSWRVSFLFESIVVVLETKERHCEVDRDRVSVF